MKRILIGSAIAIAVLTAGGIVGSSLLAVNDSSSSSSPSPRSSSGPSVISPNASSDGNDADSMPTGIGPERPSAVGSAPAVGDPKTFARTATLSLENKDVAGAQTRIDDAIQKANGIVLSAQQGTTDYTVTVRVPTANLDALTTELRTFGKLRNYRANADDQSATIADVEARTRNAQAREAALLGLLPAAKSAAEAADLQKQLAAVRTEIESFEADRRATQLRLDTAELSITISSTAASYDEWEPKPILVQAWDAAVGATLVVLGGLLIIGAGLLPLAVLAVIVVVVVKAALRRRRTTASPTPETA